MGGSLGLSLGAAAPLALPRVQLQSSRATPGRSSFAAARPPPLTMRARDLQPPLRSTLAPQLPLHRALPYRLPPPPVYGPR